jgi:hypothetical protein
LDTAQQALAFVRKHGIVTLVHVPPLRSLVVEVAGGPVKGSWWSHPRGDVIFALATALEESGEVLTAKIIDGKVTFIAQRLWPSLLRIVEDPARRAERTTKLGEDARKLLGLVERGGELRVDHLSKDDPAASKKAREGLEKSALVHSAQIHSDRGKHVTVLSRWDRWASASLIEEARRLSLDEAFAAMRDASGGSWP